jgi:Protein of unknown function (DUF3551)
MVGGTVEELAMRIGPFLLGISAATVAPAWRADAAPIYRYCAQYEDRGDVTCAYDTFQQCLDTARGGEGGSCIENPAWRPAPTVPVRKKAKRKSR